LKAYGTARRTIAFRPYLTFSGPSLAYLGLAILGGGGLRPSSVHLREPQACNRALKIVLLVLSAVALFPSSIPRWGA
jgi:hypothetical protein